MNQRGLHIKMDVGAVY